MEINLSKDSVVDERTGEVATPSEYLENLRRIERDIDFADRDIATLKADLKTAREARENLVAKLRVAVREGKVLPLLEVAEKADDPDMGDDAMDSEDD